MFTSGHDFFANGDAAICTVHGDVWRVSGIDSSLPNLSWKRFATGLYQPLGLKIIREAGLTNIRDKSKRQTARLIELADQHGWRINTPRDPEKRGGTVSIDMPESQQVCQDLVAREILVDWRPRAGVRFSPHFYNTDEEIDLAIAAVEEILKGRAASTMPA